MEHIDGDEAAHRLLEAWRDEVRPVLAEHLKGEMVTLDQAAHLLQRALERKTKLDIGFIGESQVGKSSLINALVERSALPSGGIGPLTAQATRVSFAENDRLEVTYHSHARLKGVRLLLEGALVRRGDLASGGAEASSATDEEATTPADELGFDLAAVAPPSTPDGEPLTEDAIRAREAAEQRFNYLVEQVWSMLGDSAPHGTKTTTTPRPHTSILVDGLRTLLGEQPRHPETVAQFEGRVSELRRYLGRSETITSGNGAHPTDFTQALNARAAGRLAPLVKNLDVGLNSDLVRSLSLVDLPGIGVRADPGALVAEDFVNAGGDALVVVMRNNGLSDSVARLLERTGVINRLLMEGDSPLSMHVLVVITHLDDVAKTRWQDAARAARANGEQPPDLHHVFHELAGDMSRKARSDIRGALLGSPSVEELTNERRERRAQRVEALCAAMEVVCVAAPDYLSLVEGFPHMATLKDVEATNIPEFRRCIERVATTHAKQRSEAISQATSELCALAEGHLRAIASAYEEGRGAAKEQWESFRSELEKEVHRLREDMTASHGELIAQLKTTLPMDIKLLCKEAELGALKRLTTLRRQGNALHYQSLNAALTRNAVWDRRSINYPASLTEKFVEPIASDWDSRIIGGVRGAIAKMVNRDVRLVEKLCEQAQSLDERIVGDAQIAVQKQLMQQQAKTCVSWTKERLADLTAKVGAELSKKIGQVMEAACKKAREAGVNAGAGAKQRILDTFERGGTTATEKAREHAEKLLLAHYEAVRTELETGFLAENHDPLADAFRRLTDDELLRARRSDARRKTAVRAQVARALEFLAPFEPVSAQLESPSP